MDKCDKIVDQRLKSVAKTYFERENDRTKTELKALAEARKNPHFVERNITSDEPVSWDSIGRDIRLFLLPVVSVNSLDERWHALFYGIDSPVGTCLLFPATKLYT